MGATAFHTPKNETVAMSTNSMNLNNSFEFSKAGEDSVKHSRVDFREVEHEISLVEKVGKALVHLLDEIRSSKKIKDTQVLERLNQMLKLIKNFEAMMFQLGDKVENYKSMIGIEANHKEQVLKDNQRLESELSEYKILYDALNLEIEDLIDETSNLKRKLVLNERKLDENKRFDLHIMELSNHVRELESHNKGLESKFHKASKQIDEYSKTIEEFNNLFENDVFCKGLIFNDHGDSGFDPNNDDHRLAKAKFFERQFDNLKKTMENLKTENTDWSKKVEFLNRQLIHEQGFVEKLKIELSTSVT